MYSMDDMCRAGCTTRRGIRHWETLGLLGEVSRSDGNTRKFTSDQIDRAKIIAAASFGGWSLNEIGEMLAEWGPEVYEAICTRLSDQMRASIRLVENLPHPKQSNMEFDL